MGTILSSLNAAKVICRFGTAKVTLACTAMTAVGILGFSLSHGFFWLLLCSVPLGFGAGAVDAALNNYVALHYKASHLNYMQAFYGIGVAVSPYLMSLALSPRGRLESRLPHGLLAASGHRAGPCCFPCRCGSARSARERRRRRRRPCPPGRC